MNGLSEDVLSLADYAEGIELYQELVHLRESVFASTTILSGLLKGSGAMEGIPARGVS